MPFPTENGDTIFFRPAIPFLVDQPVFDASRPDFGQKTGLGDIAFDLAYGRTSASGFLAAVGMVSTLPTATSKRLGGRNWTLGPEILLGRITPKSVLGVFPSHQWDVAGAGEDVSLTTIQGFATYLPGGGWSVGSAPIMTYSWESYDWSVPLNLTVGKTQSLGGRIWKLSLEANYYVERPDAFGAEWMIGFNVAPVVENLFAEWF